MFLNELMKNQHLTCADLCRKSGLPESTLRNILSGKTQLDRCESATLLCLADALNTTVEEIVSHYWDECLTGDDYEQQTVVHDDHSLANFYCMVNGTIARIHEKGDLHFVWDACNYRWIEQLYAIGSYRFALFLLGLVDYLNRKHHLKENPRFDAYRRLTLDQPVYSLAILEKNDDAAAFIKAKDEAECCAIPELARFNIFMTQEDISPIN